MYFFAGIILSLSGGFFHYYIRQIKIERVLAQHKIRNAIAHDTIWLDSKANKVRYVDGRDQKIESEIDFFEFAAIATAGSHLAHTYLGAIGTIAVLEFGSEPAKSLLPKQLVSVFNHKMANN